MRRLICALVMAAASAGAAVAADAPSNGEPGLASDAARLSRFVYICDATPAARRAFSRQFGAAEFVKAADVRAKGDTWITPKCITPGEARKLKLATAR